MRRHFILLTAIVLALTYSPASAALYDLSNYGYSQTIIYDDTTSLMWMPSANYAGGLMTQPAASAWAGNLELYVNIKGTLTQLDNWRLPNMTMGDGGEFASLHSQLTRDGTTSRFDFSTADGNGSFIIDTSQWYWSNNYAAYNFPWGTEEYALRYDFGTPGIHNARIDNDLAGIYDSYAWAVMFDDTVDLTQTPVPVPASLWMMASGIFCLLGYRRMGAR